MSTYSKITRHPVKGKYQIATWLDNYFGPHRYGVEFPGDRVVYPADQVIDAQLMEFWAQDVLEALRALQATPEEVVQFLDELDRQYKARWERDPVGGEGAVDNLINKGGEYAESN